MPKLRSIGTGVPANVVTRSDAEGFSKAFFSDHFRDIRRFMSVFSNADIETRYVSAPLDWFHLPHTFSEKNDLYIQTALELSEEAIHKSLADAEVSLSDVDEIVFVSSTGISAPSLDAFVLNKLGMDPHLRRTPIWGLGCAGGAAGLARGFDLARARPDHRILVVAVELCSLTFQHGNKTKSNLIATALFGDGAAAALIEGDGVSKPPDSTSGGKSTSQANATSVTTINERESHALSFVDSVSVTWPDTLDVMGWKLTDTGLDVIFSRDIPTLVEKYLQDEVSSFLHKHSLAVRDIDVFAAHPGGKKVLDAYEAVLEGTAWGLQHSREVLRKFGNMSAPTVLFVLKETMQALMRMQDDGDKYVLAFALGPGFSCEQVLLKWGP